MGVVCKRQWLLFTHEIFWSDLADFLWWWLLNSFVCVCLLFWNSLWSSDYDVRVLVPLSRSTFQRPWLHPHFLIGPALSFLIITSEMDNFDELIGVFILECWLCWYHRKILIQIREIQIQVHVLLTASPLAFIQDPGLPLIFSWLPAHTYLLRIIYNGIQVIVELGPPRKSVPSLGLLNLLISFLHLLNSLIFPVKNLLFSLRHIVLISWHHLITHICTHLHHLLGLLRRVIWAYNGRISSLKHIMLILFNLVRHIFIIDDNLPPWLCALIQITPFVYGLYFWLLIFMKRGVLIRAGYYQSWWLLGVHGGIVLDILLLDAREKKRVVVWELSGLEIWC